MSKQLNNINPAPYTTRKYMKNSTVQYVPATTTPIGSYAIDSYGALVSLLDSSRDLIAAFDINLCVIAFNAAFRQEYEQQHGTSPSLGEKLENALAWLSDDCHAVLQFCREALAGKRFTAIADSGNGQSSQQKKFELLFAPVFNAPGEIDMVAVVARDLSSLQEKTAALQKATRKLAEREAQLAELNAQLSQSIQTQHVAEFELAQSLLQFRQTFELAAVGMAHVALDGKWLLVNQLLCDIVGYPRKELLSKTFHDITHPEDLEADFQSMQRLLSGEINSYTLEKRCVRKSGKVVWVHAAVSLVRDEKNAPKHLIEIIRDITGRKRSEEQLKAQTEKLQIATEAAELGLFDHNLVTNEIIWSDRTKEHFGLRSDSVITLEILLERIHPDDRERVYSSTKNALNNDGNGRYLDEFKTTGMDGSERWISARGQFFFDGAGRPTRLIGTTMDVTERKRTEKQIRDASQHDNLTGLPNRTLLYEYCNYVLAMSKRSGEGGAILFIDLDRFKPINDLYGHETGDKVLKEVAWRLQNCTRKEDILCRLGGDEFIIVLPRIQSLHDPATVATHILEQISLPFHIGSLQLNVSPSIGVSLFPEHGHDLDVLIRCADLAMYSAKKSGRRNFQMYSPGLHEQAHDLLRLEAHLKQSLERDRFALHYQPIVDIHSGRLVGAEALVRLPAPDGSMLSPAQFIPVAEAAGLINRIGDWVLREACRQCNEWRRSGLPTIAIAVNVSPIQFRQPSFALALEKVIHDSGIDPAWLQIEVTESAVMANIQEAVATLSHLQSMGIGIALDDFGTGYSSLSHLGSLPLNKLKIDQSFIRRIESNKTSRSITEAIIGLGRTLDLKVVGEGIESEESMQYLREHGCDHAQGFFFSQPLPAFEFEQWHRSNLAECQ